MFFNGMMGKVESLTAVADWRACVIDWPVEIFYPINSLSCVRCSSDLQMANWLYCIWNGNVMFRLRFDQA